MKVFQVVDGFLYYETKYNSIEQTVGLFPPDVKFIELPNDTKAKIGWLYDNVTGEVSMPAIPEGWGYDEDIGTFYNLAEKERADLENQISQLKQQLADTDYKIIKCSEYQLANKEMPYDIGLLHSDRQTLRDSINTLEIELNSL